MSDIVIDDSGQRWAAGDAGWRIPLRNSLSPSALVTFAVSNLGYVHIRQTQRAAVIAYRSETVSPVALTELHYWLFDNRHLPIVLNDVAAPDRPALLHERKQILAALDDVLRQAAARPRWFADRLLSRRVEAPQAFDRACKAMRALAAEIADFTRHRELLTALLGDRFTLLEVQEADGCMPIVDLGDGFRHFDDAWYRRARGRQLREFTDPAYGDWVTQAHEEARNNDTALVHEIDALVRTSTSGDVHRTYTRLILPLRAIGGRRFLISSSDTVSHVDLRCRRA